jgi:hypothetical protein
MIITHGGSPRGTKLPLLGPLAACRGPIAGVAALVLVWAWLRILRPRPCETRRPSQPIWGGIGIARLPYRAVIAVSGKFGASLYAGFLEITLMTNKLLAVGLGGAALTALCCFTPLLPIFLSAVGLTAVLGVLYNDAVLFPMLAGFLILAGYALWRRKTQA